MLPTPRCCSRRSRHWPIIPSPPEHDINKPCKTTGVVTKFDLTNPHSWIYIDVKDETTPATLTTVIFEDGIVHMQGQHPPKDYQAWMGDSRGHWEGSTLIVDVANNNDKSVFDMAGHFHSDALHVVERFTPLSRDLIQYEATLDDPKVFTRPWKMKFPFKRAAKDYQIMESGCFEGERDQVHIVEGLATIPDHYEQKLNTEPPQAKK